MNTSCLYMDVIQANLSDLEANLCLMCLCSTCPTSYLLTPSSRHQYTISVLRMPFKAFSEHVKSLAKGKAKDAKMWKAVDVYRQEQDKPAYSHKGACTIAKEFGIENQWRTVINRYNGTQGVQEAPEAYTC
jgi:hypothetical protein